MGAGILALPEALPATATQGAQPDVARLSPGAPIVMAVEVARVQMLAAPVHDDSEFGVSVME